MLGTKGTLRNKETLIHNVPLLLCPVCHRVEIHHLVEDEYEILSDYALGDGAEEVDFEHFVEYAESEALYLNCVNHENEHPMDVVRNQIDMALDLLSVARQLNDSEWEEQLMRRLKALGQRRMKLQSRATAERKR